MGCGGRIEASGARESGSKQVEWRSMWHGNDERGDGRLATPGYSGFVHQITRAPVKKTNTGVTPAPPSAQHALSLVIELNGRLAE